MISLGLLGVLSRQISPTSDLSQIHVIRTNFLLYYEMITRYFTNDAKNGIISIPDQLLAGR